MNLNVETGRVTALLGANRRFRASLLRTLAGLERPLEGKIYVTDSTGKKPAGLHEPGLTVAYLPGPGEEIFTGTTVSEELAFYGLSEAEKGERLKNLEEQIGFPFGGYSGRSVWELSDSERRGLLLASQALALPDFWVCEEPQALFDGRRGKGVCLLMHCEAARGAAVLLSFASSGTASIWSDRLAVLDSLGRLLYQGESADLPPGAANSAGWNFSFFKEVESAAKGAKPAAH